MTVAIVEYGSGNLRSAAKAIEKFASEPVVVTADSDAVARADRIVLPGQGAFADCRRGLSELDGMVEALSQAVLQRAVPFSESVLACNYWLIVVGRMARRQV